MRYHRVSNDDGTWSDKVTKNILNICIIGAEYLYN